VNVLASSPSVWWYATRGSGTVALLLLTASVVLGVVDLSRWQSERWPRFAVDGVHRTVSLLAVAMVLVHIVTTVADTFTPIGFVDAVIPFTSSYRPLWLGLGAISFDLLLAVTVTSILRRRIGHRTWRAVHWAAYACWPLALLHGLGTGTDTPVAWMLLVSLLCLLAVLAAVGWRVATAWADDDRKRSLAGALGAAGLLALVLWTIAGPLGPNWASRAGTPTTLLSSVGVTSSATATSSGGPSDAATPTLSVPFSSRLSGSLHQRAAQGGSLVLVDIRSTLHGGASGSLEVQIEGQPLGNGGVSMSASQVDLGPTGDPTQYHGRVSALRGTRVLANASDGHTTLQLRVDLSIDQATGRVTGTVDAAPVGGSS
jgi:DMSO/TMAO reductase YedYZ heme-binding membrane subunit